MYHTYFQLQQKDREIEEWKNKFTGLKESHSSLKEKLDSLERYISDLPAPEELSKNAEDISFCLRQAIEDATMIVSVNSEAFHSCIFAQFISQTNLKEVCLWNKLCKNICVKILCVYEILAVGI